MAWPEPVSLHGKLVSVVPLDHAHLDGLKEAAVRVVAGTGHHWALDELVEWMMWVNLIWGACNLVPMLPWDGGHALHGVLDHLTEGEGLRPTAIVTIVTALAIGGVILWYAPGR